MRVITALALLCTLGSVAATAQARNPQTAAKTTLDVAGMACSACAKTVENAALKLPGVKAAKVDQPSGRADIEYEPGKTTPDEIAKAISKKTGFTAKTKAAAQS